MAHSEDYMTHDVWSLSADLDRNASYRSVTPQLLTEFENDGHLLVTRRDIRDKIKKLVKDTLYKHETAPRISVAFNMKEVGTRHVNETVTEYSPTVAITIEGDFDKVFELEREVQECKLSYSTDLPHDGLVEAEQGLRTKMIAVEYRVGRIFKKLREYRDGNRQKLRTMTYSVRFAEPSGAWDHTILSATKKVYTVTY
ncbi:hypothetical protein F4678DRAFT_424492 [Xylaria arbuscula]|nr:hypothetical protein F4678DRAFT_424492 [Xylaria arbuscula]